MRRRRGRGKGREKREMACAGKRNETIRGRKKDKKRRTEEGG